MKPPIGPFYFLKEVPAIRIQNGVAGCKGNFYTELAIAQCFVGMHIVHF